MNARFLEIEITGKCHHHCLHCYGSFPRKGELPKNKLMQIIDEAHDYFDAIIFSGGEPFLHPDLIELTHYAKIDKNSLFDGVSIGKLKLCVKAKAITRCGTMSYTSF